MSDEQTYAYVNARPGQRERLRTLEALLDADTIRQLEARDRSRRHRSARAVASEPRGPYPRRARGRPARWRVRPRPSPAAARLAGRAADRAPAAVLGADHRFDVGYGRRVTGDLEGVGLADVGCEGRATMWRGGQAGGRIWQLSIAQLRDEMIASGLVTPADVDDAMALTDEPRFSSLSPIVMAAWGRRPPAR